MVEFQNVLEGSSIAYIDHIVESRADGSVAAEWYVVHIEPGNDRVIMTVSFTVRVSDLDDVCRANGWEYTSMHFRELVQEV